VEVTKRAEASSQALIDDQVAALREMTQNFIQLILHRQTMDEQRIRYEGNSGVIEVRTDGAGTQPYSQPLLTGQGNFLSMKDHPMHKNTIGFGEFGAVLNGISFYTSRAKYPLVKPGNKGTNDYHSTVPIESPAVPPSVLSQSTVEGQITEMKEYFKAFAKQDISIRDYRPYFPPVLCYLEGAYIQEDPEDTDLWYLGNYEFKRNRLSFASGVKDSKESIPYLPRVLHDIVYGDDPIVQVGQNPEDYFVPIERDMTALAAFQYELARIPVSDDATMFLTRTNDGLFFNTAFRLAGTATNVTITCGSATGCTTGSAICQGSSSNCATTFKKDTGYVSFAADTVAGIAYGPLVFGSCFTFTVKVTGIPGNIVVINNPTNRAKLTTQASFTVKVTACLEDPTPLVANFDYRILCNPIGKDLPIDRLRVVDDLAIQMSVNPPLTSAQYEASKKAYFTLNPQNSSTWVDSRGTYELLDEIMESIPGKDNFNAVLNESFGNEVSYHFVKDKELLNAAYYSRFYSLKQKDAMGRDKRRRSFNDLSLFAARTTQEKVASLSVADPITGEIVRHKYSYAIPLEIVYLNPLASWNPFKLPVTENKVETARNGGFTDSTAFDVVSPKGQFYMTPSQFFDDTGDAKSVGVVNDKGEIFKTSASGIYTFIPKIAGLDNPIRQRYPIAPVSFNKNPGFMNAKALKHMYTTGQADNLVSSDLHLLTADLFLFTSPSTAASGSHFHRIDVPGTEVDKWSFNETAVINVRSRVEQDHFHTFNITRTKVGPAQYKYNIVGCTQHYTGKTLITACNDGHVSLCLNDQQGRPVTPCILS